MIYHLAAPSPLDAHRPRLEPSTSGTGLVPNYAPAPTVTGAPADPQPAPPTPRETLIARLTTLKAECLANLREQRHGGPMLPVGHAALAELNLDLAEIQRLNRLRRPWHRSPEVESWPTPAIAPTRLYALGDLLPTLTAALRVLAATRNDDVTDG